MKKMTVEEYHNALKAQGMPNMESLCVVCPMCGTVQSPNDLIDAGAGKNMDEAGKYFGFSCIGRWTHQKNPPVDKGTQEGCNWTLGGLFQTHQLEVTTPDGKCHPSFEVATKEQAEEHLAKRAKSSNP